MGRDTSANRQDSARVAARRVKFLPGFSSSALLARTDNEPTSDRSPYLVSPILFPARGASAARRKDLMYENLIRLDLLGPALARALGDPGWERLEASLVSGGKVEPDLRAHQRRGRGRAVS